MDSLSVSRVSGFAGKETITKFFIITPLFHLFII
jgi:hypothetical protein